MRQQIAVFACFVLLTQSGCIALDLSRTDHSSKAAEYDARMAHIESRLGQLEQFAGIVPPPSPESQKDGDVKVAAVTPPSPQSRAENVF